jgi:hypothetical protein
VKGTVIHATAPPKVVAPAPLKVIVHPVPAAPKVVAHSVDTAKVNSFEAGLKSYFQKEENASKKASQELKKY